MDTIEACAHALVEAEAGEAEAGSSMSIGEYQARYTTEDNASFAQLLEVDAQRRRAKEARGAATRPPSTQRIEAPTREALPPAPPKRGMMPPPDVPRVRYANCLLYTSPSPRDQRGSRMPSSA